MVVMRILHLTSHLDVGGITTYMVRLAEASTARGHQVSVASDAGVLSERLSRRLWPCTGCLTMAISEPVAAHLREVFRVPPERIRLIPHGIEIARFTHPVDPSEQRRFRRQVGLSDDGPVIGTVARLVESKGVAQLLASLREVLTQMPRAQALIVGDGDDRARLERMTREQGLAQAVRFTGSLPETRVALSVMDLFVFLPATQEGFGLSLLEAMAGARPIVAIRRGGGAPWVLEEAGVGVLVEPDDPRALADALTRLLRDPAQARRLGAQARAVAQARYDDARMIEQVEQVYDDAIRSG